WLFRFVLLRWSSVFRHARAGHLNAEQGGDILVAEALRASGGIYPQQPLSGAREQLVFIYPAQYEKQLWLFVKPRPDPIKCRGDMLAHVRPVRTGAGKLDLVGGRKQAV